MIHTKTAHQIFITLQVLISATHTILIGIRICVRVQHLTSVALTVNITTALLLLS